MPIQGEAAQHSSMLRGFLPACSIAKRHQAARSLGLRSQAKGGAKAQ